MDELEELEGTGKVLVVEDEETIRKVLGVILRTEGFTIEEAADGLEALRKISENVYDVIILDVMMPELNGFEVLKKLRAQEKTADLPVIIVSAKSTDRDILEGLKEGANYYIPKPFEPRELVYILKLILKNRERGLKF